MSAFPQVHTAEWFDYFSRSGYPDVVALGAGMEGAIYRLGDGTVAKVWGARSEVELLRLQRFYADVAGGGLPFATPVILRVEEVSGATVTFEQELRGDPLQDRLPFEARELDPAAVVCLTDALRALATVAGTDNMRQLAALDETQPLWAKAHDFAEALLALLDRRVNRFGHLLRTQLLDFDHRYALLRQRLAALDPVPVTVVHGDLFGGNILVDAEGRPTAVLDFGLLSTAGDPRLDAAISAGIMNMYGPHAQQITTALTTRLAADLGYPVEALLTYQAAYAVATSNAFTDDGSDGHFQWCVAQLIRPDISSALGV